MSARHEEGRAVDPEVAFACGQMVTSRGQSGRAAGRGGRMGPQGLWVPVPVPDRPHQKARGAAGPVRPRGPLPRRRSRRRPGGGGERVSTIPTSIGRSWPSPGDAHGHYGRAMARGRQRRVGRPGTPVHDVQIAPYCLARGGMRRLTPTAGVELGPHGIQVMTSHSPSAATPITVPIDAAG